ncbi:uncharacterized protein LOC129573096 [Sitodiplosis mosellana]|uniref:uncharacterized protein LOC129573096 n=1 Tax=Sitodiplosis mosellana TaxID=263140 RepID=UPI0024448939|nr:uncharacterized protein LOC129573096 [Sitodiplosis mosellana]
MFDVISTAKNTQWITFPTLGSKYTHSHVANEAVDFQVIPGKNCFVEFNKKFGFELLRTRDKDNKEVIQRIKKRQVDDISCGAIASSGGQIGIGMTTGFIRLFNVQSGEYVPIKFKPDRMGNSVVGLDYSSTDEYLAAVYDSADVNLFGLKTGIKTDTFRLAGISTLVRFHPTKKFALAIGSYEGALTMLDIQTKKKLFFDKTAHAAPIRDISMFASSQDLLVSCGYDCNINVFDLRKRTVVQQHKQPHPMSTVCVSSCGTFCVAGNLKGDVISYDFRSMKEPLDTKRLHDSAVVRVAFVSSVTTTSNITLDQTMSATSLEATGSMAFSTPQASGGESFAKFVDLCHYNNLAATDSATPKRRDSWADLMPVRKIHDFSMDSMAETPSRMSMGVENRSELRLKRLSRTPLDQSVLSNVTSVEQNETDIEIKVTDFDEPKDSKSQHVKRVQLPDRDNFGDLQKIQEETTETDATTSQLEVKRPLGEHDNNVSKGRKRRSTFFEMFSSNLTDTNTSSPPTLARSENAAAVGYRVPVGAAAATGTNGLRNMLSSMVDQEINSTRSRMAARMEAATNAMKARIDRRFDQAYNDMKNVLEENYLLGLQGGDNLFNRLTEPFADLENGLCSLLEQDPYALEYFRMKYEIIELKKKLGIREPSILPYLH